MTLPILAFEISTVNAAPISIAGIAAIVLTLAADSYSTFRVIPYRALPRIVTTKVPDVPLLKPHCDGTLEMIAFVELLPITAIVVGLSPHVSIHVEPPGALNVK